MNIWPKIGRVVVVLALSFSLGPHWALLQTFAWTGMLISHSHGASLKEAIAKTFDGQHPCGLCLFIEKGRAAEKQQKQQQTKPGFKLDFGLVWQPTSFSFECAREPITAFESSALSRSDQPPKPRPRGLLSDNHARA